MTSSVVCSYWGITNLREDVLFGKIKVIPLLHFAPQNNSNEYVIIVNPEGKENTPTYLLNEWIQKGSGIVLVDLSGTGENSLSESTAHHQIAGFHTLSRSNLWLGKTLLGEWIQELNIVNDFLRSSKKALEVTIDGSRETGLAALFLAALDDEKIKSIIAREAPISYLFDTQENINFFTMAVHLPGFLEWGDVSLVAGLSSIDIMFINPVSMSGRPIDGKELQEFITEFKKIRTGFSQSGQTVFTNN